jgi:hypothetical protein
MQENKNIFNTEEEDLQEQIRKLKEENSRLKKSSSLSLKVSPKGGISVYGLGRFPVTLYQGQWEKLIQFVPQIQAFMDEHPELKSTK